MKKMMEKIRDTAGLAVAGMIVGVVAVVVVGSCVLLRPIGLLIERSARKAI